MFFISLLVVSYYNQKHQYKKKYLFEFFEKPLIKFMVFIKSIKIVHIKKIEKLLIKL